MGRLTREGRYKGADLRCWLVVELQVNFISLEDQKGKLPRHSEIALKSLLH